MEKKERRKMKRQFSFRAKPHIKRTKSTKAVTTDIHLSREEALRTIAAITNTLILDPDAKGVHIVCYDRPKGFSHCIVFPYPPTKSDE